MCTCKNTYMESIHANSIIMIAHDERNFNCMFDFLLKERKNYNVNMT